MGTIFLAQSVVIITELYRGKTGHYRSNLLCLSRDENKKCKTRTSCQQLHSSTLRVTLWTLLVIILLTWEIVRFVVMPTWLCQSLGISDILGTIKPCFIFLASLQVFQVWCKIKPWCRHKCCGITLAFLRYAEATTSSPTAATAASATSAAIIAAPATAPAATPPAMTDGGDQPATSPGAEIFLMLAWMYQWNNI